MVGVAGIEPATSSSRTTRATWLRYTPMRNWLPRLGTIQRPPPYQDGALPLSYAAITLVMQNRVHGT